MAANFHSTSQATAEQADNDGWEDWMGDAGGASSCEDVRHASRGGIGTSAVPAASPLAGSLAGGVGFAGSRGAAEARDAGGYNPSSGDAHSGRWQVE